MKIGDLARAGGVGVETVRYYQRRHLLSEPVRGDGVRRYTTSDVERLRSIRAAQTAGFTLDEIATLLRLGPGDRDAAYRLATDRIAAIDQKIATLAAMRGALAKLADVCAAGRDEPCPIIAAFNPQKM